MTKEQMEALQVKVAAKKAEVAKAAAAKAAEEAMSQEEKDLIAEAKELGIEVPEAKKPAGSENDVIEKKPLEIEKKDETALTREEIKALENLLTIELNEEIKKFILK